MKILIIIFALISIVFLVDKVGLWSGKKGYLYYRRNKPQGGIIDSTLLELNAHLSPGNRYIVEMKQSEVRSRKIEADVPNKPIERERS